MDAHEGPRQTDAEPVIGSAVAKAWPLHRRPWLILLAVLAVVYVPVLFGQVFFYRDFVHWVYPARVFVRTSLLTQQSPWWNPYQGLGLPVAASPLHGLFYPPYLLTLVGSLARSLTAVWVLHVAWGGLGVLLLARRLGTGNAAALVGSLAWSLSGFVTSAWSAGVLLPASAWIPWFGVGAVDLRRALARGRWLEAVGKGAWPILGSLLVGEIFQSAMGVGFGVIMLLAGRILHGRARGPDRVRSVAAAPAAFVLAVLVAAPALLPTALAARETGRTQGFDGTAAGMWSLHPLRLVELAAPAAFGDPYGHYPGGKLISDGAWDERPLFFGVYLGASVVVLGAAAFTRRRRQGEPDRARIVGLVLAGTAVSMALALGRHTPLHALLCRLVPLFALQRAPEKFLSLTVAFVGLAAALGADRCLREPLALPWRRLAIVALIVASLALVPVPWVEERVAHTLEMAAVRAAVAVVAILAALFLGRLRRRWAPLLLVTVVATDLALSAVPLLVFGPRTLLERLPPFAAAALATGQAFPAPVRVHRSVEAGRQVVARGRVGDSVGIGAMEIATLRAAIGVAYGLADVPGYDAGLPPRLEALWRRGRDRPLALLRLLGIEVAVLSVAEGEAGRLPRVAGEGSPVALYRVGEGSRVRFVARASVLSDEQAMDAVFDADVVAGTRVILSATADAPAGEGVEGRCTLDYFRNSELGATCASEGAGFAVFGEQFARGWTARVDGREVPILRANVLGRAVALSQGAHRIDMRYEAPGLGVAFVLSGFGIAALLVCVVGAIARRRRASDAGSPC